MSELPADLREEDAQLRSPEGELMLLVARQSHGVPLQAYLTSAVMAGLLSVYVPPLLPLAWCLAVWAIVAVRSAVVKRLPDDRSRSEQRKLQLTAQLYWANGAAQAAVLGFFPYVPVAIGAVITIFIVGICAATLHATAGYARVFRPYVVITMTPIMLAWTLTPSLGASLFERAVFVGMILLYGTTLLSHARGAFDVFMHSYNIRLQRVELNRRLREALGSAESANRAKTRFLASASHDLRQPIHALSLFSGSLLLRPLDARSRTVAEQIDKAVGSLASQLDALLDISRLDAGVIERAIGTVDLQQLLVQLDEEFRGQAERKGLRLAIADAGGLQLRTDPVLFLRILRNLLSNALKYTAQGLVEITLRRHGNQLRITVADSGSGIPEAEQGRVFEEFYQLQNPERDRSKGLGLGLAIVRRLTDLLELELWLDSAPGHGSRFSVDVPVATEKGAPPPEALVANECSWQHIGVLVVDDEDAIRLGMKTLLEEMGFRVQAAASTEAAMDIARHFQPSILLADFRLRGEDNGMRTVQALRQLWPMLPALLISGDTAPDRLREAYGAEIELLHKPVAAPALREAILKAVNA